MEISLSAIAKNITSLLHRYHIILFVIFALGGLAFVIFLLNGILVRASDSTNYTSASTTTFDEATIKRIEELKTRDDPLVKLDTNGKRTNPFIE